MESLSEGNRKLSFFLRFHSTPITSRQSNLNSSQKGKSYPQIDLRQRMSAKTSKGTSTNDLSTSAASSSSSPSRLGIPNPSDPAKQSMLRTRLLSSVLTRAISPSSVSSILVFTTNGSVLAASHPAPENARTFCTILAQLHASYIHLSSTKPVESIVLELDSTTICLHVLHQSVLMAVFGTLQPASGKASMECSASKAADGAQSSGDQLEGVESSAGEGAWSHETNNTSLEEQDEETFLILKTRAETMATWLRAEMEGLRIPST
jgi:hypothetical protein